MPCRVCPEVSRQPLLRRRSFVSLVRWAAPAITLGALVTTTPASADDIVRDTISLSWDSGGTLVGSEDGISIQSADFKYQYFALAGEPTMNFLVQWTRGDKLRYKGKIYNVSDFPADIINDIRPYKLKVVFTEESGSCQSTTDQFGIFRRSGAGYSDDMIANGFSWSKIFDNCGEDQAKRFYKDSKKFGSAVIVYAEFTSMWRIGSELDARERVKRQAEAAAEAEAKAAEKKRKAEEEENAEQLHLTSQTTSSSATPGKHSSRSSKSSKSSKSSSSASASSSSYSSPSSSSYSSPSYSSYGSSSRSSSSGSSGGTIGGLGGLGAAGGGLAVLLSDDDEESTEKDPFDSYTEDTDYWDAFGLHLGISGASLLSLFGMAFSDAHPWRNHSAQAAFLGRTKPYGVLSLAFGNGLIVNQFTATPNYYGYVPTLDELQYTLKTDSAAPNATPFANMVMRTGPIRFNVGSGVSYGASTYRGSRSQGRVDSRDSDRSVEAMMDNAVFLGGIGLQFGSGLFCPFASAQLGYFVRHGSVNASDYDGRSQEGSAFLKSDGRGESMFSTDSRKSDFALMIGNTFDFHGLSARGDTVTSSPFVEVGVVVWSQEKSFVAPGTVYLTIGTKFQLWTSDLAVDDNRINARE